MLLERSPGLSVQNNPENTRVQHNREIITGYLHDRGHNSCELAEYAETLPRMHPSTIGVVVGCAFNERDNIEKFISSVASQKFSRQARSIEITEQSFETLIIVNNCSDDTVEVARYWKSRLRPTIPTFILEKNFPPAQAGLGSARKFGFDLALYRFLQKKPREDGNNDFCLISLDTENPFPQDHLEKVAVTFRITGADALGGDVDLLDIGSYLSPSTPNLNGLYELYIHSLYGRYLKKYSNVNTSGGNSAVTGIMYALAGGIENIRGREDSAFADKLRGMGAKIERLNSCVHDNPRRVLADPLAYTTVSGKSTVAYQQFNPIRELPQPPYPDFSAELTQTILHQFARWEVAQTINSEDPDRLSEKGLEATWRIIKELGIPISI